MVVRETSDQKYSEKDGCDRFHEICNLKKKVLSWIFASLQSATFLKKVYKKGILQEMTFVKLLYASIFSSMFFNLKPWIKA